MKNTVLLVVDVQTALVEADPYNKEKVIGNIDHLLGLCRSNGVEVIYVRHDDGEGSELEQGTPGWQIYSDIKPMKEERIFEKQYNSVFLHTGLREYLDSKQVKNIILVGMQTEYCMDTTCKVAFEYGYKLIIPEETNMTFDNEYLSGKKLYEFYNYKVWNKRFATVIPIEELEVELKK